MSRYIIQVVCLKKPQNNLYIGTAGVDDVYEFPA